MKKIIHLSHVFLFAISPAVFLWGQNFGEVPLREVVSLLIVLVLFGVLVLFSSLVFLRDFDKSAVMSSVFLLVILFFGYIYNIFFYNSFVQLRWRWAFLILFAVLVAVFFFLRKTKKNLSSLNKALSVSAGIFIAMSLFQVVAGYYTAYVGVRYENNMEILVGNETKELRDIYYIILDGYSSPWVVRDVMGFKEIDQTVAFLKEKDFFVAGKSQSNYPDTLFSIPSSLNMRFLKNPQMHKRHFELTENNKVKDILKSYGYKYFHFGADAFTYFNRYADENINLGLLTPYQTAVWHNTLFRPVQDMFNARFDVLSDKVGFLEGRRSIQWRREKFKLRRIAEIADKEDAPVFAFAHFLLPKGANVFDENGNFVTEEDDRKTGPIKGYLRQVSYINKEIEKLVNILLSGAGPDPIIIIQGDHGFPFYGYRDLIEEFAQPDRAKELLVPGKYSFPIFNAYYFPDGGDKFLYDTISPVNTFRVLFNYYFGQNFDILEDISYTQNFDNHLEFIIWDK